MLWWNALMFTLNACSLSGHLTSSQHPQLEVKVCDRKRQDPQNPSPKYGSCLPLPAPTPHCALRKGSHFPGTEEKKLLELVHGQRRTGHPLQAGDSALPSPTWGGGGGVKWPQRVPFSCPQTQCNRVPRCLESQLRPRLCEASLKPQKGGSSPSSAPSWGLFLLTFQERPAWLETWEH